MLRLALLSLAVVAITASAAFPQSGTIQPAPSLAIVDLIRPYLQDVATLAFTIVCGFIVKYVRDKWGIDLQAEKRNAFQIASTNAAGLYASTGDMGRAVDYLKDAAPDAIKHFEIPESTLSEKIEAKAGILEAGGKVIPVMPGVVETKLVHG